MSEKKPPDGFDPSAPPQDDEQDPHLQHTSPYDVETLAKALGSVDDEQSEDDKKFADFGPTDVSQPFQPPAGVGGSPVQSGEPPATSSAPPTGPDPRLFLDDTEVLPPGTLPAGLAARARDELSLAPAAGQDTHERRDEAGDARRPAGADRARTGTQRRSRGRARDLVRRADRS